MILFNQGEIAEALVLKSFETFEIRLVTKNLMFKIF
jgi:hypothetical protein